MLHAHCLHIYTIYVSFMQKAKVKKVLVVSFLKINKKFHIVNVIAFVGTILTADMTKRGKSLWISWEANIFLFKFIYTQILFVFFPFVCGF